MYSCKFCGNDARYGHYCTPQVPFIYLEPCYNQDFNFSQDFHDFQQQYLCCEDCGGPRETFQCQPMNYYEPNPCYDSNYSGFDQPQPLQYTIIHPIFNAQNDLFNSQNKLLEQMTSIPICYNDDDDEYSFATQEYLKKFSSAIIPDLPKSDALIMEDEHLDTIPEIELDELIKSSVEDLVYTLSESDGISEGECDLPAYDDFSPKKDEVLDDIISIPPRNEVFIVNDDHIKDKSSGSTTTHSDFSLSKYDSFIFDLSINPFPLADRSDFYHEEFVDELAHIISPPEYDCFYFKNEPKLGDFTMDVVGDIFPTREPRVHVLNVLPTHPTLHQDLDFILSSDSLFAYTIWIFLPFLTYPVYPSYLLSCRNEDTIFDPDISIYYSFMLGISQQSGTFMKFNVYPNHLNESPMEILSSTCSPMDQ
ncbi:hypothetical protein Tco_0649045 [Tanacetum coccineum]